MAEARLWVLLLIVVVAVKFHRCSRTGDSLADPSPSHPAPSYHLLSYRNAPTVSHRSTPPPRPRTTSRSSPSASASYVRSTTRRPHRPPTTTPRPRPSTTRRPPRPPTSTSRTTHNPPSTTRRPTRPLTTTPGPSRYPPSTSRRPPRPPTTTSRPLRYPPSTTPFRPPASTPRPPPRHTERTTRPTRRRLVTASRPSEVWEAPPRPGKYYPTGNQATQDIKIVNKYNYHYPGYYSMPMANPHYGGYYTSPSYHYSSGDTGSTALGFFLGYSLAKMTTPTYSHYSFYDGYRPRYDHYEVHHYYHNRDSVPQNQEIRSNTIVGCVGDSGTICPANTTSLCTSNGALMCVVSASSTTPCNDNRQVNCIRSTISCVNISAPECNNNQNTTSINIPCVSNAKVYGEIKYINNTIIINNPVPVMNSTNGTASVDNATLSIFSVGTSNVTGTNATVNNATLTNFTIGTSSNVTGTNVTNTTNTSTAEYSTKYPITTIPPPVGPPTSYTISRKRRGMRRKRREVPQDFCVAVLALPAAKPKTEGELFLDDANFIVNKFLETAWKL